MGMCFSKKKLFQNEQLRHPTRSASSHSAAPKRLSRRQMKAAEVVATASPPPQQKSQIISAETPAIKKQIFGTSPCGINNCEDVRGAIAEARAAAPATAATEAEKKSRSTVAVAALTSVKQAAQYTNGPPAPEEDHQVAASTVRTSSCSKEEVESILIQCGRLSRNSSGTEARHHRSRKRSYDFESGERNVEYEDEDEREKRAFSRPSPHRHRHRTLSRDGDNSEHKRSGSRERGSGSNTGRRTSRSPGKRSDIQVASSSSNASSNDKSRQPPGKMVSVPAREKTAATRSEVGSSMIGRKMAAGSPLLPVSVEGGNKRANSEVGGLRSASPRTRSPSNPARSCTNENTHSQQHLPQQAPSLSRSSSKKTEHSPYRRNPMSEVDNNILSRMEQPPNAKGNPQMQNDNKRQSTSRKADEGARKPHQSSHQNQRGDENTTTQARRQDARNEATGEATSSTSNDNNTASSAVREQLMSCRLELMPDHQSATDLPTDQGFLSKTVFGAEVANPTVLARTRSSRKSSKDFDANPCFNPETVLNPTSYTSLLLEDIHNYHHHKNIASFTLPPCVSKAHSILEAVADLNSSSSNSKVTETDRSRASVNGSHSHHINGGGSSVKVTTGGQIQIMESDLVADKDEDDLNKPNLLKYNVIETVVAVDLDVDLEPQESAGSNSFVGVPWASPQEPNSTGSTDRCWTSSCSNNAAEDDGRGGEEFITTSGSNQKKRYHLKQQQHRSAGGSFDASGRRFRSGVTPSASAAASTISNSSKRGRGGSSVRVGSSGVGNARASGAV